MGQDTKHYVVEVTTSLNEPATPEQFQTYEKAIIDVFKLKPEKAQSLLRRLPGVATKPLSQRDALIIAERFEMIGLSATTRNAETPDRVETPDNVKITSIRRITPIRNPSGEMVNPVDLQPVTPSKVVRTKADMPDRVSARANTVNASAISEEGWRVKPPERFRVDLSSIERVGSSLKQTPVPASAANVAARIRAIKVAERDSERIKENAERAIEASELAEPAVVREPVMSETGSIGTRLLVLSVVPVLAATVGVLLIVNAVLEPDPAILTRLGLLSLIPLVLALSIFFFATRSLSDNLRYLAERAEAISNGDLSGKVQLEDKTELGRLASSLERLRISMEEALDRFRRRR